MRRLTERLTKRGAAGSQEEVASQTSKPSESEEAERKLPPELPLFFMLSHLERDGPVRLDGVKIGVCEVMGLEIDEPKLGAFAGALNALDFPAQLLIRQHPPRLGGMRKKLKEAQPTQLPPPTWTRTPTLLNCRTHRNENLENIAARRSNSTPPEICLFSRKLSIQHFVNVNA